MENVEFRKLTKKEKKLDADTRICLKIEDMIMKTVKRGRKVDYAKLQTYCVELFTLPDYVIARCIKMVRDNGTLF